MSISKSGPRCDCGSACRRRGCSAPERPRRRPPPPLPPPRPPRRCRRTCAAGRSPPAAGTRRRRWIRRRLACGRMCGGGRYSRLSNTMYVAVDSSTKAQGIEREGERNQRLVSLGRSEERARARASARACWCAASLSSAFGCTAAALAAVDGSVRSSRVTATGPLSLGVGDVLLNDSKRNETARGAALRRVRSLQCSSPAAQPAYCTRRVLARRLGSAR